MNPIRTFDGRTLKSVDKGFGDMFYTSLQDAASYGNSAVAGNMGPIKAFSLVPWLYRAVSIRASLVSRIPFALMRGETEVTDAPEYASLVKGLRKLLYLTEASKCLTGAAYWYLEANETGRNITPRFLRPQFVQPVAPRGQGLTGFVYTDNEEPGVPRQLPLERIVYFWNPNFSSATQPGTGEAMVALAAASMLYALDSFTAGFFNSGGVKVTVFEIPASTPPADKEAFQNFLNRAMSGVRNAFKNITVRGGVKPTVIGSNVKETEAPELTAIQRDSVAVAIGVPPPLLDGKNENMATAQANEFALYTRTVLPEVDMIFETANEQLFGQFGLELVSKPEELEAMQQAQLQQVQAVTMAVGQPVLTVDEGRELLGYEPKPADGQPIAPAPEATSPDAADLGEEAIASLSLWRDAVMEAMRAGKSTNIAVPGNIPFGLVRRIDQELTACKSIRQVRAVFSKHWPRSQEPSMREIVDELRLAREALEKS